MEPERSGGASDPVSHRRTRRRRLRVRRRPPRFRRILPGRTGHAKQLFGLRIERLEIPVRVRPFGPGVADDFRIHLEVAFPQAQRHAAEEDRCAADAGNRAERVAFAAGEHAVRRVGTVGGSQREEPVGAAILRPARHPVAALDHQDVLAGHHGWPGCHDTAETAADHDEIVQIPQVTFSRAVVWAAVVWRRA